MTRAGSISPGRGGGSTPGRAHDVPSRFAARFKVAILVVVLLSLGVYGAAEHEPGIMALAMAGAVVGWFVTEGKPGRGLPRWVVAGILTLVVIRGVRQALGPDGLTVSPFAGFLATIIVLKLWERRQARDYAQILSISLFLNIGAMLSGAGLLVGVLLLLGVPALTYAVMLLQLVLGAERARALAGEDDPGPWRVLVGERPGGEGADWSSHLTRVATFAVGAAMLVSSVVFVLIPRGSAASGLGDLTRAGRMSGFNDRVELGQAGLISQSQVVVLEAMVVGGTSLEAHLGDEGQLYLRGAVLDHYSRGTWRRAEDRDADQLPVGRSRPVVLARDLAGPTIELSVVDYSSGGSRRPLFVPWRPATIAIGSGADDAWIDRRTGTMGARWTGSRQHYSARSVIPEIEDDGLPAWLDRPRAAVEFPSGALADLARRVLEERRVDADASRRTARENVRATEALSDYLRSTCSYTTDVLAAPPRADPTEWFVLTRRRGHCEYFASALAAMARCAGLDARVVAGYVASEYDPDSRTFTVRQANAHAWVEVEVAPGHWITADATPPADLAQILRPSLSWIDRVERWVHELEMHWSRGVVNFDDVTRGTLLGLKARERGERSPQRGPSFWAQLARTVLVPWGLAGVLVATGVIVWRRRAGATRPAAVRGPEGAVYRSMLRRLAAAGKAKPPWMGPGEFVLELEKDAPTLAPAASRVTELCYASWFGGHAPTRAGLAEARRLVRSMGA